MVVQEEDIRQLAEAFGRVVNVLAVCGEERGVIGMRRYQVSFQAHQMVSASTTGLHGNHLITNSTKLSVQVNFDTAYFIALAS